VWAGMLLTDPVHSLQQPHTHEVSAACASQPVHGDN
jgi:hypothetical protein